MSCPTIKKFCYCIDLKPAGIVLSLLDIIVQWVYICSLLKLFEYARFVVDWRLLDNKYPELKLALCFIGIFVDLLWLYGIFKEKPKMMLPSIWLLSFSTIIFFTLSLLHFFFLSISQYKQNGTFRFIFMCIIAVILFYTWIVQYSLYKCIKYEIAEKNKPKEPEIVEEIDESQMTNQMKFLRRLNESRMFEPPTIKQKSFF